MPKSTISGLFLLIAFPYSHAQRIIKVLVVQTHLPRVALKQGEKDSWSWKGAKDGKYTTRAAYDVLLNGNEENQNIVEAEVFKWVWNNIAPIKAAATAWRVLRDRLPTRRNLLRRRILQAGEETKCPLCNNMQETAAHILLDCTGTVPIWTNLLKWLGVSAVLHHDIRGHFLNFSSLLWGKKGRRFATCLWICAIWVIWKGRNKLIFEDIPFVIDKVVEEIKGRTWSWVSVRSPELCLGPFSSWLSEPLTALNL